MVSMLLPGCAALNLGLGILITPWCGPPPCLPGSVRGEWSTWQITTLRKCWVCSLAPVPSSKVIECLNHFIWPLLGGQRGPVVETLHLQCGGLGLDTWLGNQEPTS